jgi:putative FmdB family regulatory protein
MPTYHYECQKCGATFDFVQSMKDAPLEQCPKEVCARPRWGKGKVKRVPTGGAGLIFKGSGFYITDYRSDSYKAAAKKESGGSGGDSAPKPSGTSSGKSGGASDKPASSKPSKKD